MKKISIRSTWAVSVLGIISLSLMLIVEFTKRNQTQPYFEEKLAASRLMEDCISTLKEKHFKNEISIDNINDPNDTRIIGTRYSPITSGRGSLPVKLSTVNPNFAALLVELYKDAGVNHGDHIAIGATGSFPALNLAALSAAEVLGLEVTMIGSITSSSWGANDPNYTYPDIHNSLVESELISQVMTASSIGASQDIGRTLSPEGRELAANAISRNGIRFINNQSLSENIIERMNLFTDRERTLGKDIKLYVNIGGGVASLGGNLNAEKIPSALIIDPKLNLFEDKMGVMFEMASHGIPLINLRNIQRFMNHYDLPRDPVPLPQAGVGTLFFDERYDMRYVFGSTAILMMLIFSIIVFDKKQNALGNEIVKQEK